LKKTNLTNYFLPILKLEKPILSLLAIAVSQISGRFLKALYSQALTLILHFFAHISVFPLVGRKAKVKAIDNRIATDSPALSLMKVGTRVASAILMYSFGAKSGQDRGVLEQEVTSACLAPNLNRNILTATLSDRVSQFSVVYLSPDWAEKSREAVLEEALHWLEYRGNDKRDYKNALAFVVPSKAQIDKARKGARTALAVTSLIEKKAKYKFANEDIEELKAKVKDASQQLEASAILSLSKISLTSAKVFGFKRSASSKV
jgi:hypothetical protein